MACGKLKPRNDRQTVYRTMIAELLLNAPGVPDVRSMKHSEIKFFYETIKPVLKRRRDAS